MGGRETGRAAKERKKKKATKGEKKIRMSEEEEERGRISWWMASAHVMSAQVARRSSWTGLPPPEFRSFEMDECCLSWLSIMCLSMLEWRHTAFLSLNKKEKGRESIQA